MKIRCPLAEVINAATADGFQFASATNCVSAQLSPTVVRRKTLAGTTFVADDAISPILDLEGSAYTRYKVHGLGFEFDPQGATSSDGRYIFAFAADPAHPIVASTTAATPTMAGLESLADSVPFSAWEEWKLDVTANMRKFGQEWLYTAPEDATTTTADSDDRLGFFGAIALIGPGASALARGVLVMNIDIEFAEFCPITTTRPSLDARFLRRAEVELIGLLLSKYKLSVRDLLGGLLQLAKKHARCESGDPECHFLEIFAEELNHFTSLQKEKEITSSDLVYTRAQSDLSSSREALIEVLQQYLFPGSGLRGSTPPQGGGGLPDSLERLAVLLEPKRV